MQGSYKLSQWWYELQYLYVAVTYLYDVTTVVVHSSVRMKQINYELLDYFTLAIRVIMTSYLHELWQLGGGCKIDLLGHTMFTLSHPFLKGSDIEEMSPQPPHRNAEFKIAQALMITYQSGNNVIRFKAKI